MRIYSDANAYSYGDRNSYVYSKSYGYFNANGDIYACFHSQPNNDTCTNSNTDTNAYADCDASGW